MSKKAKNSGVIELSPPHKREGFAPDLYSLPPIENENNVYLEVAVPHGKRSNLPEFAVFIIFTIIFVGAALFWFDNDKEKFKSVALPVLSIAIIPGIICLIGSILTPPPLPLRLNRQTQEAYFFFKNRLYRSNWHDIKAHISLFHVPAPVYSLYFGFDQGEDSPPFWITPGRGPLPEKPLRMWEYYCRYMESGLPVEVVKDLPDDQKSEARIRNEKQFRNPLLRLFLFPFDLVFGTMLRLQLQLAKLTLRHARWPQEVIDVCENHPLLQKKSRKL